MNVDKKNISSLKKIFLRGALWTSALSALAIPLAYYRNWMLSKFGEDTTVVGLYAVILLMVEISTAFFMLGGSSVVTSHIPKIKDIKDQSTFVFSYLVFSLVFCSVFLMVFFIWPSLLGYILGNEVDGNILNILLILGPVIVLSKVCLFSLNGLMQFQLMSILNQLQLFCVSAFATIAFYYCQDNVINDGLILLGAVVVIANSFIILIGGFQIIKTVGLPRLKINFPSGFWSFATNVHGNTLCSFAYVNIDRIFVLSVLGIEVLGVYFILQQCADLIRFIPTKMGQVVLSLFSKLVADKNYSELNKGYVKLCKGFIMLSTCCSVALIFLSKVMANIFGDMVGQNYTILILLAVVVNMGCIGSINSMLVLAKGRSGLFLTNNLFQIALQFSITLFLVENMGVIGVVIGKFIGLLSAQIGLFIIVWKFLPDMSFKPPKEYFISQLTIILVAVFCFQQEDLAFLVSIIYLILVIVLFLYITKFNPLELVRLIKQAR